MVTITLRRLTKRFGAVEAVSDLSVDFRAGRVVGLLGPNGAGKTTVVRTLLGLAAPTSGEALIDGLPYARLPNPRGAVGAVLEAAGFHPARTGRNHLRVVAASAGVPRQTIEARIAELGLVAVAGRKVRGYSMGQRQRLALATALVGDPQILVLDEPTNGLDPEGIVWLRGRLRTFAAAGGLVIVSSHLLSEIVQMVDDVVIMSRGRLMFSGALSALGLTTAAVEEAFLRLTSREAAA